MLFFSFNAVMTACNVIFVMYTSMIFVFTCSLFVAFILLQDRLIYANKDNYVKCIVFMFLANYQKL